jgi:hypothetical protein
MRYVCTVVERDHLTVIEWRGKIVVNGTSPRVKEFLDFVDNQFEYPVAVEAADSGTTSDFDIEKHEPQNGFDLAAAVIQMGAALDLEIIITEEI